MGGLCLVATAGFVLALMLVWHVAWDRGGLPDLTSFLRFDLPVTGHVYDERGLVIATLAVERRSMVAYEDLCRSPSLLRIAS